LEDRKKTKEGEKERGKGGKKEKIDQAERKAALQRCPPVGWKMGRTTSSKQERGQKTYKGRGKEKKSPSELAPRAIEGLLL